MTLELKEVLEKISSAVTNWDSGAIPTELEFLDRIREYSKTLTDELNKEQPVQKTIT